MFPVTIPTPFAVGPVHCYLIRDEKKVLVDCGPYTEDAWRHMTRALAAEGLEVSDLDEIWLTHGHPDHFGQAAKLADISGARIYGHRKERSNFASENDRELFADFFDAHGLPRSAIQQMVEQLDWLQQFQLPVTPEWVGVGEHLTSGTLSFRVWHTPGHAAGHVVFAGDQGVVFGGDLLLKNITTNALINFDPDTGERNRSLLQYRLSLQKLLPYEGYLLPGHDEVIYDIPEVARHHLQDHEQRYREICSRLASRAYTLTELAMAMFPEAMKSGDTFLVLSEVIGYLDWGINEDQIEEIHDRKGIRYAAF